MIILGIETSCDETAAAIVELVDKNKGAKILSNVVASSADMHAKTGGIIPEEAARNQVESIIPVVQEALINAFNDISGIRDLKSGISKIDAIAVTYGPGLIGSLLVGVETAKTLSLMWNKPLIPVNHLVAHIYANFVVHDDPQPACADRSTNNNPPKFPALSLVVSGGHTDMVMVHSHGDIKWIGGTRDDAAGEAFDKTARLLGLPYPGGPAISKEADKYLEMNSDSLDLFPRPMIGSDDFDWSFSGLKTSVLNYTKQNSDINVPHLSAEIQEAIVDVLVKKSIKAVEKYNPKSFILSGGVSANNRLKEKFHEEFKNRETKFFAPQPKLSTDNAVAIAACAFYYDDKKPWEEVDANPELEIV